jgi:hypothetical protein
MALNNIPMGTTSLTEARSRLVRFVNSLTPVLAWHSIRFNDAGGAEAVCARHAAWKTGSPGTVCRISVSVQRLQRFCQVPIAAVALIYCSSL